MNKLRFLVLLAVLALMLSFPAVVLAEVTQPPQVFVGPARINGKPALPGTKVTAVINGTEKASTVVVRPDGAYEALVVEQSNGSVITFRIGTLTAEESAIWRPGGGYVLHLSASSGSPRRRQASQACASRRRCRCTRRRRRRSRR
jgi:hypothetical protein